jgi:hypothetical protein
MSPTSYQAAPPRISSVAEQRHGVKFPVIRTVWRASGADTVAKNSAGAEIRILDLCARVYSTNLAVNCTKRLRLLRDGSWLKQVGQIRRIGCITQIRPGMENIL